MVPLDLNIFSQSKKIPFIRSCVSVKLLGINKYVHLGIPIVCDKELFFIKLITF